ncbi:uncharacterized protein LOC113235816 isoform X3 [Hyposmocoma kahamanoa]|uniref:uncharacterized protein LOC113235816 isoform X3 n=1 Tax=Hyposmocoma kahamanoa TaxID=1477025 RepID=UPI000E6D925F|nr:uncharacterized protein LOC113235816 isoform X3 [Hyposmocoma kahamanoa]
MATLDPGLLATLQPTAAAVFIEYFVTALQIFEHCGAESAGALRVDALMDKFAPFVKTNKAEYTYLRSLLDPEHSNPEINVTKLATALHEYSESQKSKADLDESFNLKGGIMPQDSDSGISSDGFQLVEELQSELREKAHLAHKLRTELDFTDRQHEEALAALSAERDSLRSHLNMLRDENITLTHVRRDYEDACDRLCNSELALGETRQELDKCKRNNRVLEEHVSELEIEKSALQELLTKSKDECHRINEMYASRQSALLEENETLKTENADLSTRLQDQEEFMQQIIKEKVLLEMELKELLNKSNQTQLRLDRSIDVSYTDEQMLTALDTLNADSRFTSDVMSVSTQVEVPCADCVKRNTVVPHSGLRRYLWDPLKCLFQIFAVVCFLCAVSVLYGVSRRWNARCVRDASPVPWRWFNAQDFMDLLLRIEYVADVPM